MLRNELLAAFEELMNERETCSHSLLIPLVVDGTGCCSLLLLVAVMGRQSFREAPNNSLGSPFIPFITHLQESQSSTDESAENTERDAELLQQVEAVCCCF